MIVSNEPTLGEIARRLEAVHVDLKEDVREIGSRLDGKVSMERYQIEQQAIADATRQLTARVAGIEEAREQERQQQDRDRRMDRRLVFTALIAPVLLLILQAYMSTRGAGA